MKPFFIAEIYLIDGETPIYDLIITEENDPLVGQPFYFCEAHGEVWAITSTSLREDGRVELDLCLADWYTA